MDLSTKFRGNAGIFEIMIKREFFVVQGSGNGLRNSPIWKELDFGSQNLGNL